MSRRTRLGSERRGPVGGEAWHDMRPLSSDVPVAGPTAGGRLDRDRPAAIVVGGGVAGLTAAHELAVRGFNVHVIEREHDPRGAGRQPALGGLARSQIVWVREEEDDSTANAPGSALLGGGAAASANARLSFSQPRLAVTLFRFRIMIAGNQIFVQNLSTDSELKEAVHAADNSNLGLYRQYAGKHPLRIRLRDGKAITPDVVQGDTTQTLRMAVHERLTAAWTEVVNGPAAPPPKAVNSQTSTMDRLLVWTLDAPVLVVDSPSDLPPDRQLPNGTDGSVDGDIVILVPEAPPPRSPASDTPRRNFECAGEHGFRFFPSFYAHLFDTMRRIPVLDGEDDWCPDSTRSFSGRFDDDEVHRSVLDNLISLDQFALGLTSDGEGVTVLDRTGGGSLTEVFQMFRVLQRRLGFETRDLVRFQLRLLAYLTASPRRRREMESKSWSEYLRLDDGYSKPFVDAMDKWPQILVGMKAGEVDARTYAGVVAAMVLDPLKKDALRDATLNGPTTTAWFDPWKRFLRRVHGVHFHQDEALSLYLMARSAPATGVGAPMLQVRARFRGGLDYEPASPSAAPWVVAGTEKPEPSSSLPKQDDPYSEPKMPSPEEQVLPEDCYLVLAVSPHEAYRLLKTLELNAQGSSLPFVREAVATSNRDDEGLLRGTFAVLDRGNAPFLPIQLKSADTGSPLKHFVGLQYFFLERDVPYLRGHLFLPQHAYAITGVSQAQFRTSRATNAWTPGTLSLDLGAVDAPDENNRTLWASSRTEISATVWKHVLDCLDAAAANWPALTDGPRLYHIDDGLVFGKSKTAVFGRKQAPPTWWTTNAPPPAGTNPWDIYKHPWRVPPNGPLNKVDPNAAGVAFNNTPYLVVPPGAFQKWPGALEHAAPMRGYDIEFGNLVCCGTHMRTFTRMATMESANESARHAVNGILRDFYRKGEAGPTARTTARNVPRAGRIDPDVRVNTGYCDVYPLDQREPRDFEFAQRIDARLVEEGLPHLFEVLKLDQIVRDTMPGEDDAPTNLFDDMLALITSPTLDPSRITRWASPFLLHLLANFLKVPRGAS